MDPQVLRLSAPRARVSRSTLEDNIARALRTDPRAAIDLRRDACGHGARIVAEAARAVGVASALVDDAADGFGPTRVEPVAVRSARPRGDDPGMPYGTRSVSLAETRHDVSRDRRAGAVESVLPLEAVFGLEGRGEPAMTLVAPVLQTKDLLAGEGVSYGYRHRARRDTRVALVSGGYAQGIPRAVGSRGSVLIRSEAVAIVGRIAMDVCVVDIGALPVGRRDEATFFGPAAPHLLRQWAEATGCTEIELAALAGMRAEREVVA